MAKMLCVVLEHRFCQGADGAIYTRQAFGTSFWDRYLSTFDRVRICARIEQGNALEGYERIEHSNLFFTPVPAYIGPKAFARQFPGVRNAVQRAVAGSCAVLLRCPSTLAIPALGQLRRLGKPYAVEVVGDPWDVFAPNGGVRHWLRPLFRVLFWASQQILVEGASAVSYVTSRTLQSRYPASRSAFVTHYSSVQLTKDWFRGIRSIRPEKGPFRLLTIGSLEQAYKGVDVLIEAIGLLSEWGEDVVLDVIGDGRELPRLIEAARERKIEDRVRFRGSVPHGPAIMEALDGAELFVLASRTEGLPRVLLEAMARALACVATRVGGIPELLADECMVPVGDPVALAACIRRFVNDPALVQKYSAVNYAKALQYSEDVLNRRREKMYRHLYRFTEDWVMGVSG